MPFKEGCDLEMETGMALPAGWPLRSKFIRRNQPLDPVVEAIKVGTDRGLECQPVVRRSATLVRTAMAGQVVPHRLLELLQPRVDIVH